MSPEYDKAVDTKGVCKLKNEFMNRFSYFLLIINPSFYHKVSSAVLLLELTILNSHTLETGYPR